MEKPTRRRRGVALPGVHVAASGVRLRGRRDAGVATGRAVGVVETGGVFVGGCAGTMVRGRNEHGRHEGGRKDM